MARSICILLSLLFLSCSTPQKPVEPSPEYAAFFIETILLHKQFDRDMGVYSGNVPILFKKEMPDERVGECWYFKDGSRRIYLLLPFWEKARMGQKILLIYHELGHCALNRDHKNNNWKGYHFSIMNDKLINDLHFTRFMAEYLDELKTGNHYKLYKAIKKLEE